MSKLSTHCNEQETRPILVVEDLKGKRVINLDANIYSLGRDSRNSIVIYSPLVSRHHATLLKVPYIEKSPYLFQILDGDLQGNHSTNGLIINRDRLFSKTLSHLDIISFGKATQASYLVVKSDWSDLEIIKYYEDYISAKSSVNKTTNTIDPFETLITDNNEPKPLNEVALLRLASFPELLPNPIIEIDIHGHITYLNPAALIRFPKLQQSNGEHPILDGLIATIQNEGKTFFVREVKIDDITFEQSVYYIPESHLIRAYLNDITQRKQEEEELRQHRERLQQLVEERTASLVAINQQLQKEILERQRVEAVLRQQALVFENIHEGIVITDLQGKIIDWNPGACAMFGYSKREVLDKAIAFLYKSEQTVAPAQEILQGIQQNQRWTGEINFIRKDGTEGICEIIVVPLYNESGEIIASIAVNYDITSRKQAQAEIYKALEKEKELRELKSRFVSMASHEFRTPLARILISSDVIKSFGEKLSDEQKLHQLNKIQTAVQEMTAMLDDVTLINKAESGRLIFNPIKLNIEVFCRDILEDINLTTGLKHTFIFECRRECSEGECTIFEMDEKLLKQTLTNLLSNAVKYSPEGSTIEFNLICKNQEVVFQVRDRGIGIPPSEQKHIFEGFHRCSNVGNIPGTGLGLAIIKNAVELHKGSITFESELGVGTTFTVCLPTKQRHEI